MDNKNQSLLRFNLITWFRSGGKNDYAEKKVQDFFNIDPIESKLVLLDAIGFLAAEFQEKVDKFNECLYKLS